MNCFRLNPNFSCSIEANSFIFADSENEYLVEIQDAESQQFMLDGIERDSFYAEAIPKQFKEVFQGLVQLEVLIFSTSNR